MKRFTSFVVTIAVSVVAGSSQPATSEGGRAVMGGDPPVMPRSLFQMPTSGVVKSMDAEVSGLGVLYGDASQPALQGAIGLGDIAQMEIGALNIVSSLEVENELTSVPTAGLKVHMPVGRFVRGVAASFHRSGSHTNSVRGVDWDARVGEFHTVATVANHAPENAGRAGAGWMGIKMQTHVGAKYIDARLGRLDQADETTTNKGTFWRPVVGFELWRDNDRARVVGEINYMTGFDDVDGGSIEIIRVINGGVRFFFSRHATFDIGIRQQSNYVGIAESAIQTKVTFHLPTHALRDRVVGK